MKGQLQVSVDTRIRSLRKKTGMSQKKFAAKIVISGAL